MLIKSHYQIPTGYAFLKGKDAINHGYSTMTNSLLSMFS